MVRFHTWLIVGTILLLISSIKAETTVYSDRLSINYPPPISDAFENRIFFSAFYK